MLRAWVKRIRVLLVDDQALFCEGLRTLLSVQADLEVVGEAQKRLAQGLGFALA